MARYIYDNDGKKIGEIKSEEVDEPEKIFEDLGCLAILGGAFAVLLAGAFLYVAFDKLFNEGDISILIVIIPIILAMVAGGKMVSSRNIHSFWGAFGRIMLVGTGVGTVAALIAELVCLGHIDAGTFFSAIFVSALSSLFPAIITTWIVLKS